MALVKTIALLDHTAALTRVILGLRPPISRCPIVERFFPAFSELSGTRNRQKSKVLYGLEIHFSARAILCAFPPGLPVK